MPEGSYESIYADMPPFGLAAAHGRVPLERRGRRAQDRFANRSRKSAQEAAGETVGERADKGAGAPERMPEKAPGA
ncbi:hypothetical protein [Streptomyces sp. NPDC020571]|uniref:hypothetical protein n=1 Tax=Streptomyces sp. NPDC020571 TaxID=3365079 RepID=UPI0037B6CE7C